ncbi:MAG: NADPH:quinone oxidoreductase family protein [Rhodobacteraceae bacterium]|nr:NADPH:quinone oxidoreductase family protein [Paracoccaceae bacterium]
MRALQVTEFKTAPSLLEVEMPEPAAGEIRVKVEACGLNFADLLMIKGEYQETPALPFTLGMEIAGTVDAVGAGASLQPGQRVAIFGGQGGLADYAVAREELCVSLPDAMPATDAAAFQIAYGTSHLALVHRGALRAGEKLLVLGAAGGVGLTAVEIGAALGAEVIAVARGADKLEVARNAGAAHLIDAGDAELKDKLKAIGGVDMVYDPVGGDLAQLALRACKRGARYLVIGFASGTVPEVKLNHLLVKNIALHGFYWGGYLAFDPAALKGSLGELFTLYADGKLSPHIGLQTDLDGAADALEKLRRRETTGKVVITP